MPSQPQIQTPVETFTSEKAADENKASGQRKLRLFLRIFLKQLSEIGSKFKKKRISDCFNQRQISGSKPALWEMYEICLQGHFWVSSRGPLHEIKRKAKWRHREVGSYPVANNQMHSQLSDSRAQDGAACRVWGDPHLGLSHGHRHSTWGHSQGGHWWDTDCLYRLNQGWEARTGPGTSGSTAPKAPEKLF